jgi:UDP-N-acetyl-D-glucosamine dehydrogenase
MGINVWEVIDAAATKPFGFVPFYPGPGVGGHCIPIDPFYLTYKARAYDYHTRLIELAGEINDSMPEHVVERLMNLLNEQAKPLKNSTVLLCGVAYKGDIDDLRESPALKIWQLLERKEAIVSYYDPCCPSVMWNGKKVLSTPLTKEVIQKADVVIITTAHKENVDYQLIAKNAQLIFDTKNILSQVLNIKPEALETLHIL